MLRRVAEDDGAQNLGRFPALFAKFGYTTLEVWPNSEFIATVAGLSDLEFSPRET